MSSVNRSAPRYPASLRLVSARGDGSLSGEVTNISSGGMFVRTEKKLRVGAVVSAALELPDGDRPAPVRGKVVHLVQSARGRKSEGGVGVQFVSGDDSFHERVDRYIESLLRTTTPAVRLLSIARGLLQEKGWTQLAERDPGGSYCLSGALREAAGDDDGAYKAALQSVGERLKVPACKMGGFGCHCAILGWNDAEGRTQHDVIAKLDEVIAAELRTS